MCVICDYAVLASCASHVASIRSRWPPPSSVICIPQRLRRLAPVAIGCHRVNGMSPTSAASAAMPPPHVGHPPAIPVVLFADKPGDKRGGAGVAIRTAFVWIALRCVDLQQLRQPTRNEHKYL